MDCLFAKCIPYVTECVQGELEQMGERYRLALKIIKDPRIEKLPCLHKGIYADDCLVQRVTQVMINTIFTASLCATACVSFLTVGTKKKGSLGHFFFFRMCLPSLMIWQLVIVLV